MYNNPTRFKRTQYNDKILAEYNEEIINHYDRFHRRIFNKSNYNTHLHNCCSAYNFYPHWHDAEQNGRRAAAPILARAK